MRKWHSFTNFLAADVELLEARTLLSGTAIDSVDLSGAYSVAVPGTTTPSLAFVSPNPIADPFVISSAPGGTTPPSSQPASDGFLLRLHGTSILSATKATVTDSTHLLVGGADVATYGDNSISFSSGAFAGQVWTKITLAANYTNPDGAAVHARQDGELVTFTDKFGNTSVGRWLTVDSMFAFGETLTFGKGHVNWSGGTVWTANFDVEGTETVQGRKPDSVIPILSIRLQLKAAASDLLITNYVDGAGGESYLVRNGTTNVVFIDSHGIMSLGTFADAMHARLNDNPGRVATFAGNLVQWQDGTAWTKAAGAGSAAPVVTSYTSTAGLAAHTVENGTSQVVVVDCLGTFSIGTFTSATHMTDSRYPGDDATFGPDTVTWQDGMVWTKTTNPPVIITSEGFDLMHLRIVNATTIVALENGMTGTRTGSVILWTWPNGDSGNRWTFYDADQLNALFAMVSG